MNTTLLSLSMLKNVAEFVQLLPKLGSVCMRIDADIDMLPGMLEMVPRPSGRVQKGGELKVIRVLIKKAM